MESAEDYLKVGIGYIQCVCKLLGVTQQRMKIYYCVKKGRVALESKALE